MTRKKLNLKKYKTGSEADLKLHRHNLRMKTEETHFPGHPLTFYRGIKQYPGLDQPTVVRCVRSRALPMEKGLIQGAKKSFVDMITCCGSWPSILLRSR